MKARSIVCLALVSSLGFGSLAVAQPDRNDRDRRGQESRSNDHRQADDRRDRRGNDARGHDQRDGWEHQRDRRGHSYGARGPEWRRGGHLPREYRSRQYVVNDWRSHRLQAPPRGYHWVQVGGDYVLAAVATGVIVQLILSN
jgi:Ni/Co efflux regulator RcnB